MRPEAGLLQKDIDMSTAIRRSRKSVELQSFTEEELKWLLATEQGLARSIVFGGYIACIDRVLPVVKGCEPVFSAGEARLLISRARSVANTSIRMKLKSNWSIASRLSRSMNKGQTLNETTRQEAIMLVIFLGDEMKRAPFRPPWR